MGWVSAAEMYGIVGGKGIESDVQHFIASYILKEDIWKGWGMSFRTQSQEGIVEMNSEL